MLNFIQIFIFGVIVILLGVFAIKCPDSLLFRRFGDTDPTDEYLASVRFRGKLIIGTGILIIVLGSQHLFV